MTDSHDGFRDLSAIGDIFKASIAHMKGGFPAWEEFIARGMKFQKHFEQTVLAFNGFIDSLYKISEIAHNTKGGTYEIGTGLINLAMWHRGQEMKLKEMNMALSTKLLAPLQIKVEEWKKTTATLEREHDKELQKSIKDIKEAAKGAMKAGKSLESKMKKDKTSEKTTILHQQLEHYHHETDRHLKETEERERKNLNRVLLEERSWFCGFVNAFTRVLDVETGMLMDLERLQAILKDLANDVSRPTVLPDTTREMLESWSIPASPASLHKKMTTAPSMISVSSGSSGDSGSPVISGPIMTGSTVTTLGGSPVAIPIQTHSPTPPSIAANIPQPPQPPTPPSVGTGAPPPPPPPPPGPEAGGISNFPPPPAGMPPTSPPNMIVPPSATRPPPPTTAPPPSTHHPFHPTPINIHRPPPQFSQTLPRSLGSLRSASLDMGGARLNSNHLQGPGLVAHSGVGPGMVIPSHTANGDYIQNRSLPPVPPGEEPYQGPVAVHHSISPQDAHQTNPARSLTPVEEPPDAVPSFQEQLMNKVRGRSQSIETQDNLYSMPSFDTPPLPRGSNSISSVRAGPPPVSSKPSRPPPAVASRPTTRPGLSQAANGHAFSQSFDSRLNMTQPPGQLSSPSTDLDLEPDEDNMFARALRERRLRSVQTNDRSNPLVGR